MLLPSAAVLLAGQAALGDNLQEVYQKALQADPTLRQANDQRLATQQNRPKTLGALLPQVQAQGTKLNDHANGNNTGVSRGLTGPVLFDSTQIKRSNNENWTLQLRQTLFNWSQWASFTQAEKQATQADVDYRAAEQALIIRTSTAYFNVLAAEDNLEATQAAKEAFSRQLEQARKRFEVGLIAITDVEDAQSAYDNAVATEILAKRQLANAKEALRAIIDESPPKLSKPAGDIPLANPQPLDENQWVDTAMQQNPSLISSQIGAQIAKDSVSIAEAGHLPTVSLVVSRTSVTNDGHQKVGNVGDAEDTLAPGPSTLNNVDDQIGVQATLPIFSGGTTQANVKQAVYQFRAAREQVEATARETERQTRDSFFGVVSSIAQVQALKQALESAKTSLKATEAGYEVGTRTAVDVTDATRAVYVAQASYLKSRYDYLLSGLLLKQAAGTLTGEDVDAVNSLLTDAAQVPPTPVPGPAPKN